MMDACVDPLPSDAGGSTGTAGTGVGGSGVYTGGTAGAEVGGFAGRPSRGGSGDEGAGFGGVAGESAGFGGVAGSTAGAGGASAGFGGAAGASAGFGGAGGASAGFGGTAGSSGVSGSTGKAGSAGTAGTGGTSGTSGTSGSAGTGNSVCDTECAAEENYPCAGAPSESACVSQCITSRAGRAGCLPQDAAFRLCFATQPEMCATGGDRTITGSACSTESTALQQCLAN
ncbi:MAG TPA: hypothetical protein VGM29_04085 [Polyangiaceae bacterium]